MMLVQFNNEGWEVGCHLDGLESKEDAGSMIEMPNSFKAEDFLPKITIGPMQAKILLSMSTMIELD